MLRSTRLFGLSLLGLLLAGLALACSVPVFRYALERWRHDQRDEQFRVTVFHQGPLGDDLRQKLTGLEPTTGAHANWIIEAVDVAGQQTDEQGALWDRQKDATLPWMVLQAPRESAFTQPLLAGPFDPAALLRWADSPLRRTIASRLLAGDSVVWLLVESGDRDRDDAVAAEVAKQLKTLEGSTQLPEPDGDIDSDLHSMVPLKIAFPLLRVARTAPEEREFLRQLMVLDEDYTDATGPLLFPIFGRGRLLVGLREKEITPRLLEDATRFLCGACSCRVKAQNPGVDLLWSADWDTFLDEKPLAPEPVAEPRLVELPKKPAEAPETEAAINPTQPLTPWGRPALLGAISAAVALVLLTGWWALRSARGGTL